MSIDQLITNLSERNIHAQFLPGLSEAKAEILSMLPENVSVGIGNSKTIKAMKLTDSLLQKGYTVYDKTLSGSREESKSLKKQALLAQWYISGSNAIALDGRIVNIDHSGNRAAALTFGPDYVIIVVGVNKITDSFEAALERARFQAAPQNARRAGFNPPCAETNICVDCRHPHRVCNNLLVIEGQVDPQRMRVLIVDEEAGF